MFDGFLRILFISIGSILGANIRMEIINNLEESLLGRSYIILLVNIIATFLLGFLVGTQSQGLDFLKNNYYVLFFHIGFLGSLSTFSAFILDIFEKIKRRRIMDAFLIAFTSICSGIFTAFLGYQTAYAI